MITPQLAIAIQNQKQSITEYIQAAMAPNTRRSYLAAWRMFSLWCNQYNISPMPVEPMHLAAYMAHRASNGTSANTIRQNLSAINAIHILSHHPSPGNDPLIASTMAGILRTHGGRVNRKAPLLVGDLRALYGGGSGGPDAQASSNPRPLHIKHYIYDHLLADPEAEASEASEALQIDPNEIIHIRNKAILLLGFAGALRRSEIAALNVEDVAYVKDGMFIQLHHSKTDQHGLGRKIGICNGNDKRTCPVHALKTWLAVALLQEQDPLFVHCRASYTKPKRLLPDSISHIVKTAAIALGYDPALYSGHSLRSGLVTSAAQAGKSDHLIADQTGHMNMNTLRKYVRNATLLQNNVTKDIGL